MEKFAKILRNSEKILLATHANPDGDGLGSQMALHFYLKKIGKTSYVVNTHPTPEKFQLVDPRKEITVFGEGSKLPKVDVVFVLDTNDERLLGPLRAPIKKLGVPVIFVDHHVPEADNLDDHLIDEQYGATGELVYEFLRHMRADIDAEMALGLYVAIVTDTGSFRYKRTTARSHRIASELLQKGVQPEEVFQRIYARNSVGKTKLLGALLKGLKTRNNGKVAWITIPRSLREEYGASVEDTEAFVNQLTLIENLDVGLMFREEDDGRIKVSIRGMNETPVVGIARKFGGGGHRHAAGMRVEMALEDAVKAVCLAVDELLSR